MKHLDVCDRSVRQLPFGPSKRLVGSTSAAGVMGLELLPGIYSIDFSTHDLLFPKLAAAVLYSTKYFPVSSVKKVSSLFATDDERTEIELIFLKLAATE